jgi:hypothetical protein
MKKRCTAIALWTLAIIIPGCTDSPTAPPDPFRNLTERLETVHFIFHYAPGDYVEAERSEAFAEWAIAYLDVTPPKKIDYYKSKEWEDQYAVSGSGGRARSRFYEVWTRFPYHPHECAHLFASQFGFPTQFFLEGVAVALQLDPLNNCYESWDWRTGEMTDDVVRRYKAEGSLYPLTSIIDTDSFWAADNVLKCYRQAGSFVSFLIAKHGLEKLKQVYGCVQYEDPPDVALEKFETVYGMPLQEAETRWLDFLDEIGDRHDFLSVNP